MIVSSGRLNPCHAESRGDQEQATGTSHLPKNENGQEDSKGQGHQRGGEGPCPDQVSCRWAQASHEGQAARGDGGGGGGRDGDGGGGHQPQLGQEQEEGEGQARGQGGGGSRGQA